jgi:hypothetical protein
MIAYDAIITEISLLMGRACGRWPFSCRGTAPV